MTVKRFVPLAILGAFLALAFGQTPAPKPCIFLVQQDMRPLIDEYDFEAGFLNLVKTLPADRPVVFVAFAGTAYKELFSGKASELTALPKGFQFMVTSAQTTPYKTLLQFLKDKSLSDTFVYVITNGSSQDLLHCAESEDPEQLSSRGRSGGSISFPVIVKSPLLNELTDLCKKTKVRLVGFLVQKNVPMGGKSPAVIYRTAFTSTMDGSKGKGFVNFASFDGVFKSAKKFFQTQP